MQKISPVHHNRSCLILQETNLCLERYDELNSLNGPIGMPAGEWTGKIFYESEAWGDLRDERGDLHFNDFVITCKPHVQRNFEHEHGYIVDMDFIRNTAIQPGNMLFTIKEEIEKDAYVWETDKSKDQVITQASVMAYGPFNNKDRPDTMNLHGLWLKRGKDIGDGYHRTSIKEIKETASSRIRAVWDEVTSKVKGRFNLKIERKRPIDGLLGLHGVFLHELFHLDAFGALKDDLIHAYGWLNNMENKHAENPDLLAYLAFTINMFDLGYQVNSEGYISKV
ncbi:hypothetical protein G7Z17_g8546 [Cylindrodendrum hubeiense]|uniref:Uncharacterized protein n=1 Tax=Cylindrodendrum hubeiense TaxID=595255 RepID=A0A9P5L6F0_9HYPO|nr:hypothetical protein G7Z17_g8546 [Cylindrodendrum hubeiense]